MIQVIDNTGKLKVTTGGGGGGSVTSADLASVKGAISVISQQVSVLSARVAGNSAQMTSADNAISNAVSIVSAAQAATSAAVTSVNNIVSAISTDVTSVKQLVSVISQQVSVLSARVATNSAQMTSADNAISAAVAALSAQHTSLAASVAGAISAIAANSAQMTSADNAISNAVSIVSAAQAATSADFTSFKASINNFGDVSISSPTSTQVLRYVSATGQWVNQTITGGSGSVTSANFVSLRSVVQANSAQMTSADNAISNAVSIVSAAQAVTSAAVTSVNQIVSVISQQVSVLSARVNSNSAQMTSADNAISNAVSIVSVAIASVQSVVSTLQYPAIESVTSAVYSVVEADRGKIKYFTNATSIEVVLPNGLTSGFQAVLWRGSAAGQLKISAATTLESQGTVLSSINTAATIINRGSNIWLAAGAFAGGGGTASVTSAQVASIASVVAANSVQLASVASVVHANSADFTSFKASINNFGDVSAVPSDQQVLTWNSAAGQWVASTITAGIGSVTSAELSAVSAAAQSANNVLSSRMFFLDSKILMMSSLQSTNGSALVDVSGMVLTVAADETWVLNGYLVVSTSAATAGVRAGFSVTPLSLPRLANFIGASAGQSAGVRIGAGQLQVSGSSVILSLAATGAGTPTQIKFDAIFNVASAGTVRLQACGIASTAASPLHIMPGTYMICYRVK